MRLTRAVRRGVRHALLIADLPFGAYHVSAEEAVRNATRFVKDAGAEAVKIEGGEKRVAMIRQGLDAEIPGFGHIGLTPQSVHVMGGYRVQGKTLAAVEQLMRDATALDRGWPIATGVIEGAARWLVKDRMDITGARWGLRGAEAILKLRTLHASGDFDKYWAFHLHKERKSVHNTRYRDSLALAA